MANAASVTLLRHALLQVRKLYPARWAKRLHTSKHANKYQQQANRGWFRAGRANRVVTGKRVLLDQDERALSEGACVCLSVERSEAQGEEHTADVSRRR